MLRVSCKSPYPYKLMGYMKLLCALGTTDKVKVYFFIKKSSDDFSIYTTFLSPRIKEYKHFNRSVLTKYLSSYRIFNMLSEGADLISILCKHFSNCVSQINQVF